MPELLSDAPLLRDKNDRAAGAQCAPRPNIGQAEPARAGLPGWVLKFSALALIWGLSFVFIKIGDETLAPVQVTFGRVAFGAAALLIAVRLTGQRLPHGTRTWAHLAMVALIANVAPFTLFAYAEQRIPSSLAGICNATTPLFTVLIALLALPDERPTRRRTTGLIVGFVGVLVVLGVWSGVGGASRTGALMAMGAALCYGLGFSYIRRFLSNTSHSNLTLATGQLLAGTVELAVVTPLVSGPPASLPPRVILAVAALGALGTGLAYLLQYGVIRDAGATVASSVTYLIPVVATAAGIVVFGEHLSWNEPAGAVVVLVGAALSGGARVRLSRRRRARRTRRDAAPDRSGTPAGHR